MPFFFLFFLLSLPVLEVASIVQVNRWAGPFVTLLLLIASFTVGLYLIRSQSFMAGRRMMQAMREGTPPERTLLDSGVMMIAGVLFMIPGFVSDILAILLLIPAVRRWMWSGMAFGVRRSGWTWSSMSSKQPTPKKPPTEADRVIDVEYSEVPPGSGGASGSAKRDNSPWNAP